MSTLNAQPFVILDFFWDPISSNNQIAPCMKILYLTDLEFSKHTIVTHASLFRTRFGLELCLKCCYCCCSVGRGWEAQSEAIGTISEVYHYYIWLLGLPAVPLPLFKPDTLLGWVLRRSTGIRARWLNTSSHHSPVRCCFGPRHLFSRIRGGKRPVSFVVLALEASRWY